MKYRVDGDKIVFDKPIKKGKDNIRVYFYREVDERQATDYPIATANSNGTNTYDWADGVKIFNIDIRIPKFFGLIKGKWERVTEDK